MKKDIRKEINELEQKLGIEKTDFKESVKEKIREIPSLIVERENTYNHSIFKIGSGYVVIPTPKEILGLN